MSPVCVGCREAALSPSGRYPGRHVLFHFHGNRRSRTVQICEIPGSRSMKIPALPFTVTDWAGVEPVVYPGETGQAIWRTFNIGHLRVRQVEYSAGYLADHWCDRGHVLYVLEGQLDTELRDGRKFTLLPGMSYQVSDFGDAAHRSSTKTGVKLFIVD